MTSNARKKKNISLIAAAVGIVLVPLAVFLLMAFFSGGLFRGDSERAVNVSDELFPVEGTYHTVVFLDQDGNVLASYDVEHGDTPAEIPECRKEGFVFLNWKHPGYSGLPVEDIPIMEDMTITPFMIDEELTALNALQVAGMDTSDVDPEQVAETIEYLLDKACRK